MEPQGEIHLHPSWYEVAAFLVELGFSFRSDTDTYDNEPCMEVFFKDEDSADHAVGAINLQWPQWNKATEPWSLLVMHQEEHVVWINVNVATTDVDPQQLLALLKEAYDDAVAEHGFNPADKWMASVKALLALAHHD